MHYKNTQDRTPYGINRQPAFTLVELLAVMTIIGIILVFILIASQDARRRAEERATQSLITKLDGALNDRLDALVQSPPFPNEAHKAIAAIWSTYPGTTGTNIIPSIPTLTADVSGYAPPWVLTQRSQVIATYDYIKSEMPDVFFLQPYTAGKYGYPLNFAANPYPNGSSVTVSNAATDPYVLPLGNNTPRYPTALGDSELNGSTSLYTSFTNPSLGTVGTGIFGASYTAAAGIYKNLGYLPQGYDGVDNDHNGTVDDWLEGVGNNTAVANTVQANLANHTHNTARSEMLYALLVEGRSPLGSTFSRDDFTDKEVQDTDGDGLPEFVDAWGHPLQFFRWPILYHSDLQRGQIVVNAANINQYTNAGLTVNIGDFAPPYLTVFEEREVNPLDQNQQLVGPGWWAQTSQGGIAANNNSPFAALTKPPWPPSDLGGFSGGALAFEYFFHRLSEPMPAHNVAAGSSTNLSFYWDRGIYYPSRRAFYSKFLILSGGQDEVPGVFLYYAQGGTLNLGATTATTAANGLIQNESNAMQFGTDMADFTANSYYTKTTVPAEPATAPDPTKPTSYEIQQAAQDDISNHSLQTTGGIGGSG